MSAMSCLKNFSPSKRQTHSKRNVRVRKNAIGHQVWLQWLESELLSGMDRNSKVAQLADPKNIPAEIMN